MDDQKAIRRWFHELTAPHGVKARLSAATGFTPTQISRMRSLEPSGPKNAQRIPEEMIRKAASFFESLPPGYEQMTSWLPAGQGGSKPEKLEQELIAATFGTRRAAIAGKVEAGSWREAEDQDQSEARFLDVPTDDEFPNARVLVFEVAGDSMNAYPKAPLVPGALAVCLAYEDVAHRFPPRDGMVVVIQRESDGGHFREWSIKEIQIHDDHMEFHPRSTNSNHKPIVVPIDYAADNGTRVEIIAVLRRVVTETLRF